MNAAEAKRALAALGIEDDEFRALALVPLVEVAWADGEVQLAERLFIERFAKKKGWLIDGGDAKLREWLRTQPDEAFFERARRALVAFTRDKRGLGASFPDDTLVALLGACSDVASAAGGMFGLSDPISTREAAAIARIAADFELDAAAAAPAPAAPRGPRGRPVVGSIPDFVKDPLGFCVDAWREHGDVVRVEMGPEALYLVLHPDGVRHVLVDNARNYGRSKRIDTIRELTGDGLLILDGEPWRKHRRIIQPAFHAKSLNALAGTMTDIAGAALGEWREAGTGDVPIDVGDRLSQLTARIAGATLLGADVAADAAAVVRAAKTALSLVTARMNAFVKVPLSIPIGANARFLACLAEIDRVIYGAIAERRKATGSERRDVLGLLLEARDPETGDGLGDKELRDEAITLFGAGTDTSAAALTWTCYLLSIHRGVLTAVQKEVADVLGGRVPTLEDLPKLAFTRRVLDESMRVRPPFWAIGRTALAADSIGGFEIAPGTQVLLSPYVTHRHPAFWPNPEAFDPDRFEPARAEAMHPYQYLPFGAGARKCIGAQFAMMEMQLILPMIVQAFELWQVAGSDCGPLAELVLRPRGGLWMTVHPRA